MKLITAVVQPYKVEDVASALSDLGIHGITVAEVSGSGQQKGHTEVYRGAEYEVSRLPKARIETVVADGAVDQAVNAIAQAAATGKIGDGKIWVTNVEQMLRIRTGESGEAAL